MLLNYQRTSMISVLRHLRIHALRPRSNPARKIVNLAKSSLLQEGDGLRATPAHFAVDHNFAARIEFVDALRKIVEGNQMSAEIADLIFVRLAHVENEEILFCIETALQLFDLNFRNSVGHRFLLPSNAAKLVVVYQLCDGRMGAADRAIGIFAQLEFAEFHAESVNQQEATDERIADAQNQLDDFRGLHDADQTGKNAEHSAFGAGGNESRRWRLGIEATIAGAVFGGEDAGLAFEAEDRAIDVGFAGKDAGVVDEIARGEIIGAVGDDVEVAKQFESILAAQAGIEGANIQERVNCPQLFGSRIEFFAPYVSGGVNDLALQVGVIDDIEIDEAEGADAGGAEIQGKRRAEATGADAEYSRGFELLLALHANLGHDQMPGVAQDFILAEGCWKFGNDGGHKSSLLILNLHDLYLLILLSMVQDVGGT